MNVSLISLTLKYKNFRPTCTETSRKSCWHPSKSSKSISSPKTNPKCNAFHISVLKSSTARTLLTASLKPSKIEAMKRHSMTTGMSFGAKRMDSIKSIKNAFSLIRRLTISETIFNSARKITLSKTLKNTKKPLKSKAKPMKPKSTHFSIKIQLLSPNLHSAVRVRTLCRRIQA